MVSILSSESTEFLWTSMLWATRCLTKSSLDTARGPSRTRGLDPGRRRHLSEPGELALHVLTKGPWHTELTDRRIAAVVL